MKIKTTLTSVPALAFYFFAFVAAIFTVLKLAGALEQTAWLIR